MQGEHSSTKELTLDPQDWGAMRQLAHRMVDDMLDYLETVGERRVWTPPALLGMVMGNGTVLGALGEFSADSLNPNLAGGNHVANLVEGQVIDWCKQFVGFPEEASGLLVSGGSMDNFVGLAVARHAKAGFDVRAQGLQDGHAPLVVYGSVESHSCLQKAGELLGIGNQYYRRIPVNAAYQVELQALEEATPHIELLAPVMLNIVCFRFNPGGLADEGLNRLNQELLIRLHESRLVTPSSTSIKGKYCLRAAITNHRTQRTDLDLVV